jgi:hypothetical protein
MTNVIGARTRPAHTTKAPVESTRAFFSERTTRFELATLTLAR